MPKSRIMGAGLASSTNSGSRTNVNQVQFGNKLQGLPPTRNKRVEFVLRNIQKRSYGENRNHVFCMNQIGGIGAVGSGNRSRTFATTADGVKDCVPTHPKSQKKSTSSETKDEVGVTDGSVNDYEPFNNTSLKTAVDEWCYDAVSAAAKYGDISGWDTSEVTDMANLFEEKSNFNDNISSWDVSSVTNMREMFKDAYDFNQDLSSWNVSSVKNMGYMFNSALIFNGDVSTWDVSSVTNMSAMFQNATFFNSDISSWDVSNVTNMLVMFQNAKYFNSDISSWDVSNVTNMSAMFNYTYQGDSPAFYKDLSSWCVENIPNEPVDFATGSVLTTEQKPNWGIACS